MYATVPYRREPEMKVRQGWAWLINSTQRHYFQGSSRHALCGKFMLLKLWVNSRSGGDNPDDCASCRRLLREKDNEQTQMKQNPSGRLPELSRQEPGKKIVNL
jgi:hypothetical protein